jgi:hypothetical protein
MSTAMKDKQFSFYEYAGIIIPGAFALFGLFFVIPELHTLFARDGFGIGDLGLFVLVAYAAGHLIAAVGNLLEWAWWTPQGGMPSQWPIKANQTLIAGLQRDRLAGHIQARLGVRIPSVQGLGPREWQPITRQIYADVAASGRAARIDVFNGNYGLLRGIAAAALSVALLSIILAPADSGTALGFALAGAVAVARMHRFGVHYGKELFVQFLQLPAEPPGAASTEPA